MTLLMPRSCCVPGCKSNYSTADASGFRFPEDEQRRAQWIRAIRREDFKPTTNTVVCAKHFEQHCILTKDSVTRPDGTVITAMRGRPSLTKDACPTIFENQPNDCSEDALSQCDEIAIKKEEEDVCIKEEPIEDLDVITGCGTFVPVLKSKPRSNSDHSEDALSQCDEIGIKEEDVCTKEDPIEDFDPVTGYTIFVPTLKSKLRSDSNLGRTLPYERYLVDTWRYGEGHVYCGQLTIYVGRHVSVIVLDYTLGAREANLGATGTYVNIRNV